MSKQLFDHASSETLISMLGPDTNPESSSFLANEDESEFYRNYLLSFSQQDDICIGEVFSESERCAYCEALDEESARQYCRQIVDDLLSKQSHEKHDFIPSIDDYVNAFISINSQLDINSQALLQLHLNENNKPISVERLQNAAAIDSTIEVYLTYAQWARLLCDALAYLPPTQASGKDPYLSLAIEQIELASETYATPCIKLNPDIYQALVQLSNA